MSAAHRPAFRFHPHAYRPDGAFEASEAPREVCGRPCGRRYTGVIYALREPRACARCIADGALMRALDDADAALQDVYFPQGTDPALVEEVLRRTPAVACFNPFDWPVVDGRPLAFLHHGEGGPPDLWAQAPVRDAVHAALAALDWIDFPVEPYAGGAYEPNPYLMLFQEIDGGAYRVVLDND